MEIKFSLTSNIYLWILVFITAFLTMSGVIISYNSQKKNKIKDPMDRKYTTCMKGLMAIIILFTHFSLRLEDIGFFKIFTLLGYPPVTVFLFISGYVETIQYMQKKEKYLNNFGLKKIGRLCIPWIIVTIFFIIVLNERSFSRIIQSMLCFRTIYRENTFNWFVINLLYSYICFIISIYLTNKDGLENKKSIKKFIGIFFGSSLIWLILCISLNLSSNWFVNSFSFMIGIIFAINKTKFYEISTKYSKKIMIFGIMLTSMFFIIPLIVKNKLGELIFFELFKIPETLCVCIMTWHLSVVCGLNSKILEFCGKISYEIFLLGTGLFLIYYSNYAKEGYGIVIIMTSVILLSWFVNKISSVGTKKIINILEKKNGNS